MDPYLENGAPKSNDQAKESLGKINGLLYAGISTKDSGTSWTPIRKYTEITSATTTDITASPSSGQKIYLDDCLVTCDATCLVSIVEETSGTVLARIFFPSGGTQQVTLRGGIKATAADKKIRAVTSTAANTYITTTQHSEV